MSQAAAFKQLHAGPQILVLPNAWDAASAALMEDAGAQAVATSSAAVARAHGYADGDLLPVPTLLAAIGDVARPAWRASAVGVYRLWRDLGYAVGALLAGITADLFGLTTAVWLVGALTFLSGVIAAVRMNETLARTPAGP